jgi:hypothetical protein
MPRKKSPTVGAATSDGIVLVLTAKQQECLLKFATLTGSLNDKFASVSKESSRVVLTKAELDQLDDELDIAVDRARGNDKLKLEAIVAKVANHLRTEYAAAPALISKDTVYQFKIRLLQVHPAIWRRIQLRDGTLEDLHVVIQTAFGWLDEHLHEFNLDGRAFKNDGIEESDDDERDVTLSELVPQYGPKSNWIYEYDFGDGWRHQILFEGFPANDPKQHYPCCVAGQRACPPKDCGGPYGYAELLEEFADPNDPDHEGFMETHGDFDPEEFDVKATNEELKRIR